MCDSPMPAPAGRRSLPDSVCALPGRALRSLLLTLCLIPFSAGAQGLTPTLTVSPATSTDGAYTLTWSAPVSSAFSTKLHERVGSGSWSVVGTYRSTVTSKSYTGKSAGTYGYKTEQCGTFFGSTTCWDAAGPVSVTVTSPKPTATMSWSPASVAYGASSTLTWSSKNATACYLNGKKRGTAYSWKAKDQTRTRTDSLYCTGPGGTSATVTAKLFVDPPPANLPDAPAKATLTGGVLQFTASWTAPDDNGEAITGYGLRYRLGSGAWQDETPNGAATRATVTVAAAGAYTVHVRAKNRAGWSGFSPGATVVVKPKPKPVLPPPTPATPTGPAASTGAHTVSWTAASRATGYRLRARKDNGSWAEQASQTTLSKDFSGVAQGKWDYQVKACNSGGCSAWSGTLTITVSSPATLTVTPNPSPDGNYTVSWTLSRCFTVPFGGPVCRTLQERKGTDGAWSTLTGLANNATSYTVRGQADGTYYYRLVLGALELARSRPVTVARRPTATLVWSPTRIKAGGSATLTWGSARASACYLNGESTARATSGTLTVTSQTQTRTDKVYCSDGANDSATVSATLTVVSPPAVPAAPTGPAVSTGAHTVRWTSVTGAEDYQLQARRDAGAWTVSARQDTLSKTFSGLAQGEWDYQVRACNLAGAQCSNWSATLTVPVNPPPPPGLSVTPNPSPDGDYTVTWPAPAYTLIKVRLWQQVEKNGTKESWTVVGTYASTTTSKAFSQGTTPATYYYKTENCMTVFGIPACWGESETVSVSVGAAPATPAIPMGLTHTAADVRGDYTVSWDAVGNATRYELRESDDDEDTPDTDYTLDSGTSKAFTDKDPLTWTYQVRACNAAATPCSDWSASIEVQVPRLPAPKNLSHTPPTATGNYTVSWAAVTHAARYQLQERDDADDTWDTTYPIPTGASKAFTGKAKGTWTYRARACRNVREATCGEWSGTIDVPVATLASPANLSATSPDARGNYTLSWDAVTKAAQYQVQESEDAGDTWPGQYTVSAVRQLAFTDRPPGTRHYQVKACDADACSPWSAGVPVTVPRLPAPDNLTATTPDANGDYTLSWDAVTHATRYQLRESDDGGTSWDTTYPIATGTNKALTGKTPGAWDYQVRACRTDAATCSEWSEPLTVTVPGPPTQPEAPTLSPGDTQLAVTWTAPDDNGSPLTGYNLRYQAEDDTDWTSHAHTGTDTESTITGLTNGVAYSVQVQAVNARGDSPWSPSATATPAAYLSAPAGLSAPTVSDGHHTVRWQPSPGATCYELGVSNDNGQTWTIIKTGDAPYKAFSAVRHGAWTYRVRACDGMQTGAWSTTITVTVGAGSIPKPPKPKVTPANEAISETAQTNSDKVGALPGRFRVTEQGSAGYRIDLSLPPGTAGVTPPLALAYDSRRGNGLLGIGWAIEGLSAVTRCRQTLGQDGAALPIAFSQDDRFCLDGQRLVQSREDRKNNVAYGAPGSTYRTETDGFLTVTANGGKAGHPDCFEVKRKDGSTATYGATGTSDAEHKLYAKLTDKAPTENVLTWALQEVRDSVGNKITYHYALDANGHRLTHVRYAYGDPGSTTNTYKAEVALAYTTDRKDPTRGYLAGHPVQHAYRLKQLTVRSAPSTGGLVALYNYRLDYRPVAKGAVDSLSRLVSVQGCVGSGASACQPKTVFAWSDPANGFAASAKSLTLNNDDKWTPADFNPADINGDGWVDLVWTETKGSKHRLRYALTNKDTGQLEVAKFDNGVNALEYEDDYGASPYGYNLRVHTEVADYNGDGRQDLLVYSAEADTTRLHLAVPEATGGWRLSAGAAKDDAVLSGRYYYADLNADGLLDAYQLVITTTSPYDSRVPTEYGLEVRYLKPAGKQPSSSRYYAFAPAETLSVPFEQLEPTPPPPGSPDTTLPTFERWRDLLQADMTLADVDGDGRADLIAWERDWYDIFNLTTSGARLRVYRQVHKKDGVKFEHYGDEGGIPVAASGYAPRGLQVRDLNQDGLSDLVYFKGGYKKVKGEQRWFGDWHYRLSTGTRWTAPVVLLKGESATPSPTSLSLYDDNGDGYPDVLWHDVKAKRLKIRRYQPGTGTFAAEADVRNTLGKDEDQYFTADVDGDGQADLLHVADTGDTETLKTYRHNTTMRPHLVTGITNGLGAKTVLTYESLSRTDAYARIEGISTTTVMQKVCAAGRFPVCLDRPVTMADAAAFYTQLNTPWAGMDLSDSLTAVTGGAPVLELMGPLYVVTQVQSSAPTGADATATSGIGYLYEQAKVQAAGRGLLGFKSLTTMDLQTGVSTTTTYRQDFPYIGYPQSTEVRTREDKLLRKAINTWQLKGYDKSWNTAQPTVDLAPFQPYLAKAVERACSLAGTKATKQDCVLSGDASKDNETAAIRHALHTVTTTNTHDDWGNPTRITVTTEDHINNLTVKQTTANKYGSTEDSQRYGRLSEAEVTRQRDINGDDDYLDKNETLTRLSRFAYHTTGAVKGLLKSETREPDDARLKHQTTYHYDRFGHRIRAAVTAARDASGSATETRCDKDTVAYDSAGRYVIEESDCLGRLRRQVTAHNGWGQPTAVTQRLNADSAKTRARTTTHTYTAGGWLAVSRESTGAWTGQFRAHCTGSVSHCPTGAAYYIETRQAGGATQWDYRDVLDRVVRTRTLGFADKSYVITDTEYDNLGRVARTSAPYYEGKTAYWTTYTYDLLGRVIRTTLPDYETNSDDTVKVNSLITTAYAGLTTTTTNGKGQTGTELRNALGEVIKSTDDNGASVTHTHDAWGQVIETTTGTGDDTVTVAWAYDARGRRTVVKDTHLSDYRQARYTYTYNGFDEVIAQTDRSGNRLVMTYDGLGRLVQRRDYTRGAADADAGVATWVYDSAGNGLGQLARVTRKTGMAGADHQYERTHAYDEYGRESVTTLKLHAGNTAGRQTYYSKQTYDELGRPYQHYDARLKTAREEDQFKDNVTEIQYNDRGYAHRWVDGVHVKGKPRRTYRTIESLDARGNVTKEQLGGGVVSTRRTHDEKTGRITGITSKDALTRPVQADTYTWDVLGNLTGRTAQSGNNTLNETFAYDTLSRLTTANTVHEKRDPLTQQVTGTHTLTPQTVTYDALGNITHKSDVGDYTYDARHPYAVSQTKQDGKAATRYHYDQQGNLIGDNRQRRLTYTPFNKVARITRNTTAHIIDFAYGPDRDRFLRIDTSNTNLGASTTTTVYLGNVEHVIAADKSSTYKRYLAGGSVLIIQDYDKQHIRTGEDTRYLLKDHLGSLSRILDKNGILDQSFSFDAWGERRNPDDASILASLTLTSPIHTGTTTRGYTGHEMLDAVGIIHMNGRIYDAKLGRFLQADPVIQFPNYTQSWNRYSYVLNNPLAYTDPSGYILGIVGGILGGVVGFIACGPSCAVKGAAIGAGLGTSADVLIRGGSLGQALLAGVSAAAFTFAAGGLFPGVEATFGQVLLYGLQMGVVGGITTTLQGGNFGNGFLVAGTAALVGGALARSGWFQGLTKAGKFVTSSVVGGTVSRITGGKFANGALTSAFVFLANSAAWSVAERAQNQSSIDRIRNLPDSLEERQAIFNEGLEAANAQKLIVGDVNIVTRLNEINIATSNRLTGGYDYQQFTSKSEALAFLKANPSSFAADGVYYGNGNVRVYATAVSSGTRLAVGSLFTSYVNSGNYFGSVMTGVENVLQTITHETGHHLGYSHGNSMYNREFLAIKRYRQGL